MCVQGYWAVVLVVVVFQWGIDLVLKYLVVVLWVENLLVQQSCQCLVKFEVKLKFQVVHSVCRESPVWLVESLVHCLQQLTSVLWRVFFHQLMTVGLLIYSHLCGSVFSLPVVCIKLCKSWGSVYSSRFVIG